MKMFGFHVFAMNIPPFTTLSSGQAATGLRPTAQSRCLHPRFGLGKKQENGDDFGPSGNLSKRESFKIANRLGLRSAFSPIGLLWDTVFLGIVGITSLLTGAIVFTLPFIPAVYLIGMLWRYATTAIPAYQSLRKK